MKNIRNLLYTVFIGLLVILSGCSEWLDINEDPNNPTDVPLNQLMVSAQVNLAGAVGASVGGLGDFTSLYTHYTVQRGTSQNDYAFNGGDFGVATPWVLIYPWALTDIKKMIEKGIENESWHYVAIGQIMKAYLYSVLVDLYGEVPYYDANKGSEVPYPTYDDDEAVYQEVFNLLDEGIANLAKSSTLSPLNDDIFYGGGPAAITNWRKFAKTLKLKLYNQTRLVWDNSSEINALLTGNDLIDEGEDFEFQYGGSIAPDNRNPAYTQEYTPGGAYNNCSPYFSEIMKGINTFFPENIYLGIIDPRVPYYFYNQLAPGDPAENPTAYRNGDFVSIYMFSYNIDPNEGFDQASSQTIMGLYPIGGRYDFGTGGPANFNGVGDTPQRILTYFQRKYIEAELALTGVSNGNARNAFEDAMQASFDKVNEIAANAGVPLIDPNSIDAYMNAVLTRYDAADNDGKLEHVMTQKWIASYGYAIDPYTDYRRTGYPILHDGNTDDLNVTVRTREYALSFPWVTTNLEVNPNAPSQKLVNSYRIFWDAN
jgi:hypothetical protein